MIHTRKACGSGVVVAAGLSLVFGIARISAAGQLGLSGGPQNGLCAIGTNVLYKATSTCSTDLITLTVPGVGSLPGYGTVTVSGPAREAGSCLKVVAQSVDEPNSTQKMWLTVVEVAQLDVDGASAGTEFTDNYYAGIAASGFVVFTAETYPEGEDPGCVTWTGATPVNNDDCAATVTLTQAALTFVQAWCGSSDTDTIQLNVLEVAHLSIPSIPIGGLDLEGTLQPFPLAQTGSVAVSANLLPGGIIPDDVPSGIVSWSGGTAGADPLTQLVSQTAAATTVVRCTVGASQKSITIVVYNIVPSAQVLWYFDGYLPGNYGTWISITAQGLPSTGNFEWAVTEGKYAAVFLASGSSTYAAPNANPVNVGSAGSSVPPGNDVIIQLTYNGTVIGNCSPLTVDAPNSVIPTSALNIADYNPRNPDGKNPLDLPASKEWTPPGFYTWYYWTICDILGRPLPNPVVLNESVWPWGSGDLVTNNWDANLTASNAGTGGSLSNLFGDSGGATFRDYYAYCEPGANPACLNPHNPGWKNGVTNTSQYYRVGTEAPGQGTLVQTQTVQFNQGCGRATPH